MPDLQAVTLVQVLVGLSLLWGGYQILYRKRYALIAGYHPERTKNPETIARMLGPVLLIGGACLVIAGIARFLFPTLAPWNNKLIPVVAVGMLFAVAIGSIKINRDLKRPER